MNSADLRNMALAVGASLLMLLLLPATSAQVDVFYPVPQNGDSCRTYQLTSKVPYFARLLESQVQSFQVRCPQGKVVDSAGQCVDYAESDRCQPAELLTKRYIQDRCAKFPTLVFADPYSCNNYYDCSVGLTSIGCPQRMSYDDVNKTCRISPEVQCGERPASYSANDLQLICTIHPAKIIPRSDNCNSFYNCSKPYDPKSNFQPYHDECPYSQLFDVETASCRPANEVQCDNRPEIKDPSSYSANDLQLICTTHPTKIIPRSDNCNSFYNCSKPYDPESNFQPYHDECPYLQLFDVKTASCRPANEVQCGNRPEIKDPCKLTQFVCARSIHCRPCNIDHPDCTGLPDGNNPLSGQTYTPRYARCLQGRSLGVSTCSPVSAVQPRLFDARTGQCASIYAIPRSLGGAGPEVLV